MLILYKFILKSVIHTQSDTTFLGRVKVYPGRKHLCVDVEINFWSGLLAILVSIKIGIGSLKRVIIFVRKCHYYILI